MIITITGKPCSGKGTVAKLFAKKYNYEYVCTGDMFRKLATEMGFDDILTFQTENSEVNKVDHLVDNRIIEIGKTRSNENIIIDSRLAWHFIPNSFKVFIDVDIETAGERLLNANRETEQVESLPDAIETLQKRWSTENDRYTKLYRTNNLNLNNYNLVINSSNLTPEEIVEQIKIAYDNFIKD